MRGPEVGIAIIPITVFNICIEAREWIVIVANIEYVR